MAGKEKRNALIIFSLVAVAVIILAISLPVLELQPGMPPPEIENNQVKVTYNSGVYAETIPVNRFIMILVGLLAAGAFLYSMVRVLRGASWRDIVSFLISMVFVVLIIGGLLLAILALPHSSGPVQSQLVVPTPQPRVTAPLGPVPPILLWIVGGCLFICCIVIAVWIFRIIRKKPDASDLIAREAEKARQSILLGVGLKDVIILCYRQMSNVIQEDRGITRKDNMTTLEFEETLVSAGFSLEPVHELTRMFNAARYGDWQPSAVDEGKAIRCFEAITRFAQTGQGGE